MFQRRAIAPRAVIRPEFWDALTRIYTEKYADVARHIRAGSRNEELKMQGRLFRAFLTSSESRDRITAKLASLPYEEFGYRKINDREFLYGKTRDIILETYRYSTITARHNIGPYWVLTDFDIFFGGSVEHIHLIPARFPNLKDRHPHHYAIGYGGSPSEWDTNTCLGSFAGILTSLRNIGDIPEWFRVWHIFLSRHDDTSNLCHPPRELFGEPL